MITLDDGVTTVILRNPTMENLHKLSLQIINRQTKGLQRKIYRSSSWPKQETLNYIIEACTTVEKDNYLAFTVTNYGKQITLTDYEGLVWTGILIPGEITQSVRDCGFVISFEFEGTHP